jgi:hypothetical protein
MMASADFRTAIQETEELLFAISDRIFSLCLALEIAKDCQREIEGKLRSLRASGGGGES